MTPDAPPVPLQRNPDARPIAAITGATGFLGRFIVQAMAEAGWKPRLLVRRDPIHPQLPDLNAELVFGDLSDRRALEYLCADAEVIVHAAGLIKAKDRDSFFRVNEEGSARLAQAAARTAPAARIIGISSLAAREPSLSDYAASKNAGETALFENSEGSVVILRPSAIYGRWDRETFPLFQLASRGLGLAPKSPTARVCLIHATDVACAVSAVARATPTKEIYELSDEVSQGYQWSEIIKAAGKALNNSPRIIAVPPRILKIFGVLSEKSAYLLGNTPILTQGKIREMLHEDWGSHPDKQPPPGIWKPQINLREGFRDTADWYRQHGWM